MIYVINLDSQPERYRRIRQQLESLNVSYLRVPAVDGDQLDRKSVAEFDNTGIRCFSYKHRMTNNEIACYLSHLKVWKRISNNSDNSAIVLEDDIILSSDFAEFVDSFKELNGFDILKLYKRAGGIGINRTNMGGRFFARMPFRVAGGTYGYAISKQSAEKLSRSMVPFARPIDVDMKRRFSKNIDVVELDHDMVSHIEDNSSTIEIGRKRTRYSGNCYFRAICSFIFLVTQEIDDIFYILRRYLF